MVRKIPTETSSFQAVRLPLHPARFPHQIDDSTCWQIGWATNCKDKTAEMERLIMDQVHDSFDPPLAGTNVFPSYLLLVVVDSKPKTRQAGYSLLEGLLLNGILALVPAAVQDCGHLALVATHAQQLDGKVLTELLQGQVLRLREQEVSSGDRSQSTRTQHEQ